jgi:hypothetical protein
LVFIGFEITVMEFAVLADQFKYYLRNLENIFTFAPGKNLPLAMQGTQVWFN